ncbi:hypothetical protein [uncultured Bacteroides sp.]|uniref:hypothetical protein n=1 Tax=uncultured Bacteroides sp. TaxID=162156 RepID=UPI0025920554|nr:hypothetical protein [uncultured Bacteroides sp.]
MRKDQIELYIEGLKRINENIPTNFPHKSKKRCFHPLIILRAFYYSLLHVKYLNLNQRLYLASNIIYMCNIVYEINSHRFDKIKRYICFFQEQGIDNLLTQYFNKKGSLTISFSEAPLFRWENNIPIDIIHFEIFESKKYICWSEYTIEEFRKAGIANDRLFLGGYLKNNTIKEFKKNNIFKRCLVLLCRDIYSESNIHLIDMLSKLSNKHEFSFKLHPSSNYMFYKDYIEKRNMNIIVSTKSLKECLDNNEFDFGISVNSTTYYDVLLSGIPCFRYFDNTFDIMKGYDEDIFSNLKELETIISKCKHSDINQYCNKMSSILSYALGYGINNYKAINFIKLSNNE